MNFPTKRTVEITETVGQLSYVGALSILKDLDHVTLFGDEDLTDLHEIIQHNLNKDLLDEIEVLIVLSGE